MNSHSNRIVYKGAFLLALLFFSCQSPSFLVRKYLPRNGAESELQCMEGESFPVNSSRSALVSKHPIRRILTNLVSKEGSCNLSLKEDKMEASTPPAFYRQRADMSERSEAKFQILSVHPAEVLKDTLGTQHLKKIPSAKKLGRATLIIPATGLLLFALVAALAADTPLVFGFAIVAFFACILGLAYGIKCYKTARLSKEKMPVTGKFGLVLSILGILSPVILLITILVLLQNGYFNFNFQLRFV